MIKLLIYSYSDHYVKRGQCAVCDEKHTYVRIEFLHKKTIALCDKCIRELIDELEALPAVVRYRTVNNKE